MKKFILFVTAAIMVSVSPLATAATWNIDQEHSNIQFSVKHLMVSNVKGVFNRVQGAVEIDDKNMANSSVNVKIETDSINTGVAKRDEHLKSADFFDVANYPAMTFVSKKVAKSGKEKLKVTGDLTIHGVTKSVVLNVSGLTKEAKDPWGNTRRGASATTKINRKDFGLAWNKALETGGVMVGDEVIINLEVEMIKAPAK
jgi:polyisoprenoid-binding protein YceI